VVGIGASIALFVINMVLRYPITGFDTQTWIVFVSTALVSQLIGYMALAYALGHLPASIVAPTMVLQPVVTAILAPCIDRFRCLARFRPSGRGWAAPLHWPAFTWST
jgi:drug/metabolite transporter (DMT)-like permease